MNPAVRVRIAPSPTGDPHVGTAYVALFNYVFAHKNNGKFILRIEDTDQVRAKASSEQLIIETLKWTGLSWDEGPDVGGPYGPYRQSERTTIYRSHAEILLETGHAYRCFCSHDRLDELRRQQRLAGKPTGYDRFCRSLTQDEVHAKMQETASHVVRLKMPVDGTTIFTDGLRGKLEFENGRLDDQVLLKGDGYPTYHLANVVDDHLMKISHVIRAEEWIASTPKHVILYEAFGWDKPEFIHLPLLRNADKSKISKRKNPVSLHYYRRSGILPTALVNFLALMGWSFGNDVEIYSLEQMIEKFDFKDVHLGGPVFDLVKLTWLNQNYIHKMSDDEFVHHLREEVFSAKYLKALKPLVLERMAKFDEFVDHNAFFFSGALNYKDLSFLPAGKTADEIKLVFEELVELLDELYEWNAGKMKDLVEIHKTKVNWKPKDYFMTLRFVATGRKDSPPLFETLELIGREIVRFRIRDFLVHLKSHTTFEKKAH